MHLWGQEQYKTKEVATAKTMESNALAKCPAFAAEYRMLHVPSLADGLAVMIT